MPGVKNKSGKQDAPLHISLRRLGGAAGVKKKWKAGRTVTHIDHLERPPARQQARAPNAIPARAPCPGRPGPFLPLIVHLVLLRAAAATPRSIAAPLTDRRDPHLFEQATGAGEHGQARQPPPLPDTIAMVSARILGKTKRGAGRNKERWEKAACAYPRS